MSGLSSIQWTDRVWNAVVGCTKVSQGCKHCYAQTLHDMRHKAYLAGKLQNIPQYAELFEKVQLIHGRLRDPLSWRKPARVFVNSMSDLFHEDVPDAYLDQVFAVMSLAPRHTFQILTKRAGRMRSYLADPALSYRVSSLANQPDVWGDRAVGSFQIDPPTWPLPNVWLGVSIENQAAADERIPLLLQTPAAIRFLSCEPLLGPVDLTRIEAVPDSSRRCGIRINALTGTYFESGVAYPDNRIRWVIVGGESGKGARPCEVAWIRSIVAQCRAAGVAPFVKQLGSGPITGDITHWRCAAELLDDASGYALSLRDSHGGDPAEWPDDLRVRGFPEARP